MVKLVPSVMENLAKEGHAKDMLDFYKLISEFGALQSTFVWQEISNSDDVGTQSEDFALTDLSLGYRLKNRRGTLDLHISNLFDRNFRFQDSRFINADPYNTDVRFIPDRVITARFKLNF